MEEHTQIKSRQCKGMSDPEGTQINPTIEKGKSVDASDAGASRAATKFDDDGPNCCNEGPMEEQHTSRTR